MQSTRPLLFLFLLFTCILSTQLPAQILNGSNVLLIVADDLGVDKIASYGVVSQAPIPVTPNIDLLTAHGIRFERAWAQSVCSPTRASIFTGLQPFDHGVGAAVGGLGVNPLPGAAITLAEVLHDAGYLSGMFGKWHLGTQTQQRPWEQGWDYYSGSLTGDLSSGIGTGYDNWERTVFNGTLSDGFTTDYPTKDAVDSAISWIRAQQDTTWFASVTFNAPHTPFHLPNASCDGVLGTIADDTLMFNEMVTCMDFHIGRLIDSLLVINQPMLENTVVIFIGDNGTARLVSEDHPAKVKSSIYKGGVHVPMIIADGASLAGSPTRFLQVDTTEDALVHVVDLFASIGEIAQADVSTGTASRSMIHLLTGSGPGVERNHLYSQIFADSRDTIEDVSVFNGTFKLNYHFNRVDSVVCYELFDMIANPEENCNLLDTPNVDPTHFMIAARMRNRMNAQYQAWNEGNPGNFPNLGSVTAPRTCTGTNYPPDAADCTLPANKTFPSPVPPSLLTVYPNPSSSGVVQIDISLPESAEVALTLKELSGRVVNQTQPVASPSGNSTLSLKTVDIPTGLYYLGVTVNGVNIEGKLLQIQ